MAKTKLKYVFSKINTYCEAIYYGGSNVDSVIDKPHDYDYICFAKPLCKHHLRNLLTRLGLKTIGSTQNKTEKSNLELSDFSQVRVYPYTQID